MGLALTLIGILILVVTVIFIIVNLIKTRDFKKKSPKQGVAIIIGGVLAFSGIYMLESDSVLSGPNGDIVATINKVAGKKAENSDGKKRVERVGVVEDVITGGGSKIVTVTLNADEHATVAYTRDVMLIKSAVIFPALFKDPTVSEVKLDWLITLVDQKGNNSTGTVMSITFTRANAIDVNWDNFNIYNFPIVADHFYEHNAFK